MQTMPGRGSAQSLILLVAPKPLAYGLAAGLAAVTMQALPTSVIPNPFFSRMTPVRPQDYVYLAVSSVLIGLIFATFALPQRGATCEKRTLGGGILNTLAIGCPICNHVVVGLLGVGGALTYWAPLQPLVGAVGVGILVWTLRLRLRGLSPAETAAA